MTDLITRARKEWCDDQAVNVGSYDAPLLSSRDPYPCPSEVVAALLDVLENLVQRDVPMSQTGEQALRALGAIAEALEEK